MQGARAADDWWHTLPAKRRIQLHTWFDKDAANGPVELPGQYEIPIPTTQPAERPQR